MQVQKRIPKHTEGGPAEEETIVEALPDVTDSLNALNAALEDKKAEKARKRQEQKERENLRRCCGLIV